MPLGPGSLLGPYEIVDQLGRGGMAAVFKAYQPALERHVAIKVLPEFYAGDPDFKSRFHREAVAVASLRHPNILHVFDHGEHDGLTYIVTELVEGGTLDDKLGAPIPPDKALAILEPVASAIDYAHAQGVLHRDIKPSNILIARDGSPVLGDFGLAKMTGTKLRLTRTGMIVGTPEYMAPEQCAGEEPGPAADIYSFAVVAYEMLTGKVPFSAKTPAAVILAQIQSPLPPPHSINPDLTSAVEAALSRGLAKAPEDRPASCAEFVRSLSAAPGPGPVKTAAAVATSSRPRLLDRRRLLLLGGAGLVVVVGGGTAATLLSGARVLAPSPTPSSGPSARPVFTPVAEPAGLPAHAALVYQAAMKGDDLTDIDANGAEIHQAGGLIEVTSTRADGHAGAGFKAGRIKSYLLEIVMSVSQGADFEIDWQLRTPNGTEAAEVYMHIDTANETLALGYAPYQGDNSELAANLPLAGLQSGRQVTLSVLVNQDLYAAYAGSDKIGSAREGRVTGAASPGFSAYGKSGSWRLSSVRYYGLS